MMLNANQELEECVDSMKARLIDLERLLRKTSAGKTSNLGSFAKDVKQAMTLTHPDPIVNLNPVYFLQ